MQKQIHQYQGLGLGPIYKNRLAEGGYVILSIEFSGIALFHRTRSGTLELEEWFSRNDSTAAIVAAVKFFDMMNSLKDLDIATPPPTFRESNDDLLKNGGAS